MTLGGVLEVEFSTIEIIAIVLGLQSNTYNH